MSYVGKLRKKLFDVIDAICAQREKYFASSGKDFTRKGKFMPQDIFKSILLMENKSLSHELLPYFEYKKDTPTPSAFVQARAKIKPEGFEAVFNGFVSETTDNNAKYLHKGYRIFAVDGSDSHVPDNPDDPDSYFPNSNDRSYNLFHIDAMYDLLQHTYTDVVIKKKRTANERAAFIDMVEKHRNDETPIIFTADRGYESYNDMAHVTECGHKFVIRVKDIDSQGIISDLGLPDTFFDKCMTLKLTRRATNKIKEMKRNDVCIRHIMGEFDYLPKNYDRQAPAQFYELPVRIVRFKVKNTTEVIMTNLPQEEFSAAEIKKIYGMRWGIETSFRDLKHTIGLNYYHAKKSDSILQEIYSRMVMYNFSQLVTNSAKIKRPKSKRGRKFAYKKMMYYGIYMLYLYDTDQIDAMRQPVREMTAYLRDRAFEPNLILQYYWLIFYYSRYELNPQLADCFLDKVSSVIFADKDANAKRVLGYYYFGIVRDIEAASRYVKEGLAVIDNFSTGDERDIEKILLLTLQDYINKYISANPSIPQASPIP